MPAGRYRIVGAVVPLIVGRGATDTYTAEASVYLKKPPPSPPPYYVAAEYICSELAHQLRLPVPPSFVAELPGEPAPVFCSLAFNLAGTPAPNVDPALATSEEPDLCSGVIVFDAWIVNTDRHAGNVSFQATRSPHRLNIFDHSHALFFYADWSTFFSDELGITGNRGNRHCFLDLLPTGQHVAKWVERIKRIPEYVITEIFNDAIELGLPEQLAADGARFMIDRRDRLGAIIDANRHEFSSVSDWPIV